MAILVNPSDPVSALRQLLKTQAGIPAAGGDSEISLLTKAAVNLQQQTSAGGVLTVTVADDAARFALTATQAPNGAIVTVTSTGLKFVVTDSTQLGTSAGYSVLNPTGDSQIQLRRGTTAELDAITPADGEPVWDTTLDQLRVGNGSTVGGKIYDIAPASTLYAETLQIARSLLDGASNRVVQFWDNGSGSGNFAPQNSVSGTYPNSIFSAGSAFRFIAPEADGTEVSATLDLSNGYAQNVQAIPQLDNVLQGDEVFSSETLTNLSTGFFYAYPKPSGSGNLYTFEAFLPLEITSTAGVKLAISNVEANGVTVSNLRVAVQMVTVSNPATVREFVITAFNTPVGHTGDTLVNCYIRGTFQCTAMTDILSNVLYLTVAKNSAGAGTVTVKAGASSKIRFAQ